MLCGPEVRVSVQATGKEKGDHTLARPITASIFTIRLFPPLAGLRLASGGFTPRKAGIFIRQAFFELTDLRGIPKLADLCFKLHVGVGGRHAWLRRCRLIFRERVVAVVDGGVSCRQAAARFGVGVSSAIRWHALVRREGTPMLKRQGGERRSGRIEAHAWVMLAAVAKKSDVTLVEHHRDVVERAKQQLPHKPPEPPIDRLPRRKVVR